MKKLLILAALFPVLVFGQTTSQNYVKTKAYKVPTLTTITTPTLSQAAQNITYFDGLGRPIEKVAYKQSGTGHDIVIPVTYDKWGRQPKDYLPVVSGQTLNYHGIDSTAVISYYSTPLLPTMEATTYPYSEKLLEDSPLNRIFKQASPGDDWHLGAGNEVKMDYQTNEAGGSSSVTGSVRLYTVSGGWNSTDEKYDIGLYDNGNYLADSLYVTITKNENWQPADGGHNTTEEFKDKQGRVVLKRTFGVSLVGGSTVDEAHDTYYVYDDYGNLTFVIPPIVDATVAVTQTMLDDLCYQYIYDARNRLVEKKLPGKQWEFIVYNNQDKPVATGPVLNPWGLGGQGWLITKYDAFGRVAYTGWYNETAPDASGRKALQDLMPTSWAEKRDAGAAQIDDVTIKYTNDVYPTDLKLLTINYYDSYDNPYAVTPPSYIEGEAVLAKPVTLPTTSWVRVLTAPDETQAETVTTFYDTKGQVIGTRKTNHLGGHTNTDSKLDFTGKADYTICKHTFNSSPPEITVKDTYEYSDQDRLLVHKHQINSLPEELIAKNDYDDLGQLISKQVGGEDTTAYAGLQKVDYRYNIRGWLTDINNIDTLSIGSNPEDLFAFKINYNKSYHNEFAVPALYNGNISETLWVSSTDNVQRKYNYQYDNLNRLRYARYEKPQGIGITDMYDEQVDYDKNGNIQHLNRNGDFDADDELHIFNIDQLNYTYDTDNKNRLMRVEDTTTSTLGFKDDNSTGSDPDDDYTYDDFGNMLSDTNKKIDSISYNHLNLPIRIIFAGGNKIQYLYNAAGQKVRKTVTKSSTDTVTDYQDGFQYSDSKLSFFNHAEGYVNVLYCSECEVKTRYNYVFNYLDHLGNIRMSYAVDPDDNVLKILEENHYYPFGLKHTNYNSGAKGFEKKEGEPEKTKIDEISPFEILFINISIKEPNAKTS